MINKITSFLLILSMWVLFLAIGNEEPPVDMCMEVTEIPANYESYLPTTTYYKDMKVPSNYGAIAYMYHTAITKVDSPQYFWRTNATTDEYGFRKIEDYYLVAMGTYYGSVGDKFRITMSDGSTYKVLLGDIKSDLHTDPSHRVSGDGSIVEFIVEKGVFEHVNIEKFRGIITKIEKELD